MKKFALIILNVLIFTLIQAFGSDTDCWSKRPAYLPGVQWNCEEEGKLIFRTVKKSLSKRSSDILTPTKIISS